MSIESLDPGLGLGKIDIDLWPGKGSGGGGGGKDKIVVKTTKDNQGPKIAIIKPGEGGTPGTVVRVERPPKPKP